METGLKLLIYNDSVKFGGHEKMTQNLINELTRYVVVIFVYNECLDNKYLFDRENDNLYLIPITYESSRFQLLRNHFLSRSYKIFLSNLIEKFEIKVALVCQGNIELSSAPIYVFKEMGVRIVSYIPIVIEPHRSFGIQTIKDLFRKHLYNSIDEYLLCDLSLAKPLRVWVPTHKKVTVLPNFIMQTNDIVRSNHPTFKKGKMHAILPGRIEFNHKGQLKFLKSLSKTLFYNLNVDIIGDGSDYKFLLKWVKKNRMSDSIRVLPWKEYVGLQNYDLVLFASLYEGLPLLFLEAMQEGKYIVANKIPIFEAYLDDNCLFELEDAQSLEKALHNFTVQEQMYPIKYKLDYCFSHEAFDLAVLNWIKSFV